MMAGNDLIEPIYITFEDYKTLGGTIQDEITFELHRKDAEVEIDFETFERLKKFPDNFPITDNVRRCMAIIINILYESKGAILGEKAISSFSNDGFSISYGPGSTSSELKYKISSIIRKYLANEKDEDGRRILYRGILYGLE